MAQQIRNYRTKYETNKMIKEKTLKQNQKKKKTIIQLTRFNAS